MGQLENAFRRQLELLGIAHVPGNRNGPLSAFLCLLNGVQYRNDSQLNRDGRE